MKIDITAQDMDAEKLANKLDELTKLFDIFKVEYNMSFEDFLSLTEEERIQGKRDIKLKELLNEK